MDELFASLFLNMPAKIVKIEDNFCEVSPMYIQQFIDEDGEWNYETLPPITDVPLLVMQSGDYFVNTAHKVGDFVTLLFTNKDFYDYYQSNGDEPFIGTFSANNDINNAVALPFSLNKQALPPLHDDCWSVEKRDGSVRLLVGKSGEIQTKASAFRVGAENASQATAKATETKQALDAIINWINTTLIPPLAGLGIVLPPITQNTNVASTKLFTNG